MQKQKGKIKMYRWYIMYIVLEKVFFLYFCGDLLTIWSVMVIVFYLSHIRKFSFLYVKLHFLKFHSNMQWVIIFLIFSIWAKITSSILNFKPSTFFFCSLVFILGFHFLIRIPPFVQWKCRGQCREESVTVLSSIFFIFLLHY